MNDLVCLLTVDTVCNSQCDHFQKLIKECICGYTDICPSNSLQSINLLLHLELKSRNNHKTTVLRSAKVCTDERMAKFSHAISSHKSG